MWDSKWFIPLYFNVSGIHNMEYWLWPGVRGGPKNDCTNFNYPVLSYACMALPATVRVTVSEVTAPPSPTA